MPQRTKANHALVVAMFEELRVGRAVARHLNLHENTVYQILRLHQGKCRRCGKPGAIGRQHCQECLEGLRREMQAKRKARLRLGLCQLCDERLDGPSKQFCSTHRIKNLEWREQHDKTSQAAKRGTPEPGVPNDRQRRRVIRARYGVAGLAVWDRDDARCVVCAVTYLEKSISIHHVDGNDTHSTEDNMVCLCARCHRLVHLLIEHPYNRRALAWIWNTYPAIAFD